MSDSWRITRPWHRTPIPIRLPVPAGRAASRLASPVRTALTAWWLRAVRGRFLPAELRAQLALGRGERILAAGFDPDGRHALIATNQALHHRDAADGWSRLGWELITEVGWDGPAGRLVIWGVAGIAPARTVIRLRDQGTLAALAEERISYTRLGSWALPLNGRRVLAEARRRPVTGELLWLVNSPGGLNLDDGQVRRQVNEAVAQLSDELGITRPPGPPARLTAVPRR